MTRFKAWRFPTARLHGKWKAEWLWRDISYYTYLSTWPAFVDSCLFRPWKFRPLIALFWFRLCRSWFNLPFQALLYWALTLYRMNMEASFSGLQLFLSCRMPWCSCFPAWFGASLFLCSTRIRYIWRDHGAFPLVCIFLPSPASRWMMMPTISPSFAQWSRHPATRNQRQHINTTRYVFGSFNFFFFMPAFPDDHHLLLLTSTQVGKSMDRGMCGYGYWFPHHAPISTLAHLCFIFHPYAS